MEQVSLRDLYKSPEDFSGKEILLKGWVKTARDSKTFGFIELNDGTYFKNVQIVYEDKLENFNEITKVSIYSSIEVEGTLVLTPEAKQPFEVKASKVSIFGKSDADYPLQKKGHSVEFLREQAYLRPRTNLFNAVFRVRSVAAYAIHEYFQNRGYVYVHSPLITANDGEGAGEMFQVTTLDLDRVASSGKVEYDRDFFGKKVGLTVTGQLEGEAYAHAFGKIYTFGPTFRAENSNTKTHAAEFWMIEPEICFADLNDDIALAEDMVKFIIKYVLENCPEEMAFFDKFIEPGLLDKLDNVVNSEFGRIDYTDAIKELEKVNDQFEFPVHWGTDIQTEHERYITEKIFGKPVFVMNYPKEIKAFYMKQNDDGKTVAASDMLVPGIGELIGGSQREDDFEKLRTRIKELNMNEEDYWWYLNLRRFGSTVHSGFGLGFERMMMYLTGIQNIRDTIPFPRTPKNCEF